MDSLPSPGHGINRTISAAACSASATRSRAGNLRYPQNGFCINSLHHASANTPGQLTAFGSFVTPDLIYGSAGRIQTNVASFIRCFCFQLRLPGLGRSLGELLFNARTAKSASMRRWAGDPQACFHVPTAVSIPIVTNICNCKYHSRPSWRTRLRRRISLRAAARFSQRPSWISYFEPKSPPRSLAL